MNWSACCCFCYRLFLNLSNSSLDHFSSQCTVSLCVAIRTTLLSSAASPVHHRASCGRSRLARRTDSRRYRHLDNRLCPYVSSRTGIRTGVYALSLLCPLFRSFLVCRQSVRASFPAALTPSELCCCPVCVNLMLCMMIRATCSSTHKRRYLCCEVSSSLRPVSPFLFAANHIIAFAVHAFLQYRTLTERTYIVREQLNRPMSNGGVALSAMPAVCLYAASLVLRSATFEYLVRFCAYIHACLLLACRHFRAACNRHVLLHDLLAAIHSSCGKAFCCLKLSAASCIRIAVVSHYIALLAGFSSSAFSVSVVPTLCIHCTSACPRAVSLDTEVSCASSVF